MIGTIIVSYLLYLAVSSWIFWALAGVLFCLVGITISSTFRFLFALVVTFGLITLYHANF